MLRLHNGRIRYQRQSLMLPDITINPGEVVGLTGPSGCGKSSLARVLAGIQTLDSGWLTAPQQKRGTANPVQWVIQQPEYAFNPYLTLRRSLEESWRNNAYKPLLAKYGSVKVGLTANPDSFRAGNCND